MGRETQFTPPAARRWAELGGQLQTKLLNNVWCGECRRTTTIVNFKGKIERGDLILVGECIECAGPVARLIEGV